MATFFNQATLSYRDTVTNSNVVTGEITEVLSATKTSVDDEYGAGDSVTYVVSIVNGGTTPFTGLTLTDNLGSYSFGTETRIPLTYEADSLLYYVNGVLQATPTASTDTDFLVVSGINVPAGGNAQIIYSATVNEFAPLAADGTVVNQAAITGGGLANDLTVSETITAASEAQLTIAKAISPAVVAPNGQLTYTFVIRNTGNTAAETTDNVTVNDTFDPILENITVTYNGTTWSEPANYTYDETTGAFATVPGQITVPAATFTVDPTTGAIITEPGTVTLTVTGTV